RVGMRGSPATSANISLVSTESYSIRRLFWIAIIFSSTGWFFELLPMVVWFNGAQLIKSLLAFQAVLTLILFLSMLQQDRGFGYFLILLIVAIVPAFASAASSVLGIFVGLFIVLLHEWHPWIRSKKARKKTNRIQFLLAGLVTTIVFIGLLWEGGVKPTWRPLVTSGQVKGSSLEKTEAFFDHLPSVLAIFDWDTAIYSSVARVSSGVGYFSHIIDRVPEILPHEKGFFTWRTIEHITVPRFLFPDKPNLGSDSWMIITYAGLPAAGLEQMTSIGSGYMSQFYIDWGVPIMFVPLFFYGLIIGFIYKLLRRLSPSYNFFRATVIALFVGHFAGYESEIAKALGGLIMQAMFFAAILYTIGPWLHRKLLVRESKSVS
ncbi:MAG: hypothetical protein V3U73_08770, partial [bacterium]